MLESGSVAMQLIDAECAAKTSFCLNPVVDDASLAHILMLLSAPPVSRMVFWSLDPRKNLTTLTVWVWPESNAWQPR